MFDEVHQHDKEFQMFRSMTNVREDFFRDLRAPFSDDELCKVRTPGDDGALISIYTRAIENRLDKVCGPDGWSAQYESTSQGYKCDLWLLVPTWRATGAEPDENNGWRWLNKGDGIARSEMLSWYEQDSDNRPDTNGEENWGFKNAFLRAAQDAWGIGRYVRVKVRPGRVERSNIPLTSAPGTRADANKQIFEVQETEAEQPNHEFTRSMWDLPAEAPDDQEPQVPVDSPAPTPNPAPLDAATSTYLIQLPHEGDSVFDWAKKLERRFGTPVLDRMIAEAKSYGWPEDFCEWTSEMTRKICLSAAARLMDTPHYKGEFDQIADQIAKHRESLKVPQQTVSGVALANLRKLLRVGLESAARFDSISIADPTRDDLREEFLYIASQCENCLGSTGEVPESLEGMIDATWMVNMLMHIEDIPAAALGEGAFVWEYSVDF